MLGDWETYLLATSIGCMPILILPSKCKLQIAQGIKLHWGCPILLLCFI